MTYDVDWANDSLQKLRRPEADPHAQIRSALLFRMLGVPVAAFFFPRELSDGRRACACGKAACSRPAKHPMKGRGIHSATLDVEELTTMLRQVPRVNPALQCGRIIGLDHDSPDATREMFRKVPGLRDASPLVVETPRGGAHQYFGPIPAEWTQRFAFATRRRQKFIPGMDWQADFGAALMAPGARGMNGNYYRVRRADLVLDGRPLGEILPPPPERLLEVVCEEHERRHARRAQSSPAWGVETPGGGLAYLRAGYAMVMSARQPATGEEFGFGRNATLNYVAYKNYLRALVRQRRQAPDDVTIPEITYALGQAAEQAGLQREEIDRTLASAYQGALEESGALHLISGRSVGTAPAER